MKQVIIFDLDGTLIDTPRGIVDTFLAVLAERGFTSASREAIRSTIGLPLGKAFADLQALPHDDLVIDRCVKRYQEKFKEIVLPKARALIFDGVVEGLTQLKREGYKLAVGTSKVIASAELLLQAAGLYDYFDLVVGADQVSKPKPNPEMGLYIVEKLGAKPKMSIMVGDTTHDLLMAKDAGMRSIAVTYGVHDLEKLKSVKPDCIVDSFVEVISYICSTRIEAVAV